MEEVASPTTLKYHQVQQKIGLLAQSKLQNLSENCLKHIQDRINLLEKKIADEIHTKEATVREYRLKLTTFQNQNRQIDQKVKSSLKDRWTQIRELKQQIENIMNSQTQERMQKDTFSQENSEEKMEKLRKNMVAAKIESKQDIDTLNRSISTAITRHQEILTAAGRSQDGILSKKMDNVYWQCGALRETVEKEMKKGEGREKEIMQFLKGVVSEMKAVLSDQKVQRERKRDKLRMMIQEATKNLAVQ